MRKHGKIITKMTATDNTMNTTRTIELSFISECDETPSGSKCSVMAAKYDKISGECTVLHYMP